MNNLKQIPFAIGYSKGYSGKNNSAELVNMYVHMEEAGSKSNHILVNTEGAEIISSVEFEILGIYEFNGDLYIATTERLYKFNDETEEYTELGKVNFTSDVTFADNGISVVVVGSGKGHAYTPGTEELKDMSVEEGWYPSDTVGYMDGYFIFNRTGTGQFFISKLYSTELNPLDWATAESAPDDTVAIAVSNRQLWLFGERSTEIWYDSGDPLYPFTRINGAVTDIGLTNHKTIAKIRESLFFVGNDFKVYMTVGYQPTIVSTPSVEKLLQDCDYTKLTAFSFNNNGHWFYALHIDDTYTLVFDKDTKQWHRRTSCDTNRWFISGTINRHNSNNLVGYAEDKFYSLSMDHLTEDGAAIRRQIDSLPFNDGVNRFKLAELQLDMEVAQEVNAEVILQTSKDGGITWGNNNYSSTGAVGRRLKRVRWLRLGMFRDCMIRIIITDPISIRIIGLEGRIG